MTKETWEDRRRAALQRHWKAEAEMFGLRPWEMPPCMAGRDTPPQQPSWRTSWPRAKELREQLLAANPDHYADLDPPEGK